MTDEQLETLLRSLELDNVERTESAGNSSKIRQAICAFANDIAGRGYGVIFIGVRDDGSCANLNITDDLLVQLAGMRSDGAVLPFPTISVTRRRLIGCDITVIEVQPSDNPPVRFDGRAWIRVGPRRAQATPEEERRLTEKRRWGILPFDQHAVPGATLGDIDLVRFRIEYLPTAVSPEVLADNNRTIELQLAALRLLTREGGPTITAILVLGKDPRDWLPGAYIQFVRYEGTAITDSVRDQKEVSGVLGDQLRRIDEILAANISVAAMLGPTTEVRQPDYPIAALQQYVRNAVMHRNYEMTNAPTRVYWYTDRIEISSPGGPYGYVNRMNFGAPGIADYRNPSIAECLKNLGFVQRFGMGIPLAQSELAKNGNPPAQYDVADTHVLVTLRPRP